MIRRLFFVMLLWLGGVSGSRLSAQDPAADPAAGNDLKKAFTHIVLADEAWTSRNAQLAVSKYRDAIAELNGLKERYPGFRTQMIDFRISYCREQMQRIAQLSNIPLEPETDKPAAPPDNVPPAPAPTPPDTNSVPVSPTPVTDSPDKQVRALQKELRDLKKAGWEDKYRAAASELADSKKQVASLKEAVKRMSEENAQLQKKASSDPGSVTSILAARRELEQKLLALQDKLTAQERDAARKEERISQLADDRKQWESKWQSINADYLKVASAATTMTAELTSLRNKQAAWEGDYRQLEKETARLRRQTEQLEAENREIAVLKERLDAAVRARDKWLSTQKELEQQLADANKKMVSLQSRLEESLDASVSKMDELKKKVLQLEAECDQSRAMVESARQESNAAVAEAKKSAVEQQKLNEKLQQLKADNDNLSAAIKDKTDRLATMEKDLKTVTGERDSLKKELEKNKSKPSEEPAPAAPAAPES